MPKTKTDVVDPMKALPATSSSGSAPPARKRVRRMLDSTSERKGRKALRTHPVVIYDMDATDDSEDSS